MGPIRCCPNHEYKTRGAWSPEEDQILIKHIELHGSPHNWRTLPGMIGLDRCGKSCRLRWNNYLAPGINKEKFTAEEEETIIKLQASLGNKWSKIAKSLPGRTDNDIKNHWGTRLRRRLISQVIDLNTEPRPSNDVSTSSSASTVTTTATATATNDSSNNGEKNGEVNVELSLAPPNYYYEDEDKSE